MSETVNLVSKLKIIRDQEIKPPHYVEYVIIFFPHVYRKPDPSFAPTLSPLGLPLFFQIVIPVG